MISYLNDCQKNDRKETMTARKQWLQQWLQRTVAAKRCLGRKSHESFLGKTWACRPWSKCRTKASFSHFSHLHLADFEGDLARKPRFHQFAARSGGKIAPHYRTEPCQPVVAQIPVFWYHRIPNSISFSITRTYSITHSYYLIQITCVFSPKRRSGVRAEKTYRFFFTFWNTWTQQNHFDCKRHR